MVVTKSFDPDAGNIEAEASADSKSITPSLVGPAHADSTTDDGTAHASIGEVHPTDKAISVLSLEELKSIRCWVSWQYESRDNGKMSKCPYIGGTGRMAKTDDGTTWRTFDECVGHGDGVGFVLVPYKNAYVTVIDLDHCITDGVTSTKALAILRAFNGTYIETSPSGTGYHIVFLVDPTRIPNRGGLWDTTFYMRHNDVEVYVGGYTKRFMTFTGNATDDALIVDKTDAFVDFMLANMRKPEKVVSATINVTPITMSARKLIAKARMAKNGDKFSALYDGDLEKLHTYCDENGAPYFHGDGTFDQSAADFALLGMLAYWTQCDPKKMESIFSSSALGSRDKWQARADYRERSIYGAIDGCTRVYTATRQVNSKEVAGIPTVEDTMRAVGGWRKVKADGTLGGFYPNNLGKAVMYRHKMCYIDEIPYIWTGDRWAAGFDAFSKACADLDDESVRGNWQQAFEYARLYIDKKSRRDFDNGIYVAFNNCVMNARTGEIVTPTSDMLITNVLKTDYNPHVSRKALETARQELSELAKGREDIVLALKCMIGSAMTSASVTRQMCVCIGENEDSDSLNGKSFMGRIVTSVVGENNASSVRAENLDNPFIVGDVVDKLVVVAHEAKASTFNTDGSMVLKAMVSHDRIFCDFKFSHGYNFEPHVTVITNMNGLPKFDRLDNGLRTRLYFVPFGNVFKHDLRFADMMLTKENVEAFAILGLEGLHYLIEHNGNYPEIQGIDKVLGRVQRASSVVSRWVYDEDVTLDSIVGYGKAYVFGWFQEWAVMCNEDIRNLTANKFGRELNRDQSIVKQIQAKGMRRLGSKKAVPKEGGTSCKVWTLE